MVLKAVFLELNGVIIRDTDIQRRLIDDILINENLRPDPMEYGQVCFGRSDRTCLSQLLARRGRVVSHDYLETLLVRKSQAYIEQLSGRKKLPLYPGLEDWLYQLKTAALPLGLVTGARQAEVTWVLEQAGLADQFVVMVTGEDLTANQDKPSSRSYELAIARLQDHLPGAAIAPQDCLTVEASFAGITAAKQAGVPVVGVAHLYPYRMIQRRADWAVDYLNEIDLAWIQRSYSPPTQPLPELSG